jgi:hypothetical protein
MRESISFSGLGTVRCTPEVVPVAVFELPSSVFGDSFRPLMMEKSDPEWSLENCDIELALIIPLPKIGPTQLILPSYFCRDYRLLKNAK